MKIWTKVVRDDGSLKYNFVEFDDEKRYENWMEYGAVMGGAMIESDTPYADDTNIL